ncbi:response regulator transcription factor [Cohnella suwonensis]|uniref:Response regulator transcription factor n=1 Tax=Cohnella suwonensis TaxID=696072 RepID=A0ABW0LXK9_9BACL
MLAGRTIKEIGQSSFISEIAVKKHLGHVYQKLGVKNKVELMAKWLEGPRPE